MSREAHRNVQGRRSGGYRPWRFNAPNLSLADIEILRQEAMIREEFGEEGVKLFWERLPQADNDQPRQCEATK
jgi:hypothetical protein